MMLGGYAMHNIMTMSCLHVAWHNLPLGTVMTRLAVPNTKQHLILAVKQHSSGSANLGSS